MFDSHFVEGESQMLTILRTYLKQFILIDQHPEG